MSDEKMQSEAESLQTIDAESVRTMVPTGELGVRGSELPPEERVRILDELFFEGERRVPYLWRFGALMVFSSTIAAFGLMNDSSAVVIGAMLVAPLMTPLLGLSAATVQSWTRRQLESLAIVTGGALIGIAIGWITIAVFPEDDKNVTLPAEVLARTAPNLLDLGIAIAAGAAGAYVMIRKEAGSALPGVGIAVALVPPLATIGITLGVGRSDLADGAFLLFLTNLVCITLSASLVFLAAGFVPQMERLLSRRGRRWSFAVTVVAVLIVAVPLTVHTLDRIDESRIEGTVVDTVAVWAPTADVDSVEVDKSESPAFVVVQISGPDDPGDPNELAALITDETGRSVEVEVLYTAQIAGFGVASTG